MLKRRRRIQKYINALKTKKQNLSKHTVLQYSLSKGPDNKIQNQNQALNKFVGSSMQRNINTSYDFTSEKTGQQTQQLWHDSEDQQQLQIDHNKSIYKKLSLSEQVNQKQYEGKLKSFYQKKYKLKNWAQVGDGQQQLDIQDYLDQQQNYILEDKKKDKFTTIKHLGRTTQKHQSIVTGMDWYGSVLFTCGFDQKLKIFKVNNQEDNPELKIKIQKDILLQKLPLTNCFYNNGQIYCGTLRKNLAIVDPIKQKITFVTSSFLGDHKKYENLRVSKESNQKLLFSGNKISILDYKNTYTGSLLANDQLKDVKFGKNPYQLFGVTNDAILEWDLRNYKPVKIDRTMLGYSSLQVSKNHLCAGSRLGMIYIYQNNKTNQNTFNLHKQVTNLTTTISHLSVNPEQNLVCALSKWKNNAARVIELNTGRCIGNWPTTNTKIQFGNVGGFSGNGDMFGVGSSNGFVNIFNFQNMEV